MKFEIVSEIRGTETIASGHGIHILSRLVRLDGRGNWRKLKGLATVRLEDASITEAEVRCFEAHGIGKRRMKIKRLIGEVMSDNVRQFAVCVRNEEHEESLELRKI